MLSRPLIFFVCPSESWEDLKNFQTYLQSLGDSVPAVSSMQAPVVGQIVLARSEKDNSWYRGTVIRLQKTKAKIYCPDFGFVEKISLSNLRPVTDLDVARANYWGNMCTLSDWREGERDASHIEVEWIKTKLKLGQAVNLTVSKIVGVKFTVDIQGIRRC